LVLRTDVCNTTPGALLMARRFGAHGAPERLPRL